MTRNVNLIRLQQLSGIPLSESAKRIIQESEGSEGGEFASRGEDFIINLSYNEDGEAWVEVLSLDELDQWHHDFYSDKGAVNAGGDFINRALDRALTAMKQKLKSQFDSIEISRLNAPAAELKRKVQQAIQEIGIDDLPDGVRIKEWTTGDSVNLGVYFHVEW